MKIYFGVKNSLLQLPICIEKGTTRQFFSTVTIYNEILHNTDINNHYKKQIYNLFLTIGHHVQLWR